MLPLGLNHSEGGVVSLSMVFCKRRFLNAGFHEGGVASMSVGFCKVWPLCL